MQLLSLLVQKHEPKNRNGLIDNNEHDDMSSEVQVPNIHERRAWKERKRKKSSCITVTITNFDSHVHYTLHTYIMYRFDSQLILVSTLR
jgi:hypothetical protein